jgi:hypothetical protein
MSPVRPFFMAFIVWVRDDIAWIFATFEEHAADVLEAYRATAAARSSASTEGHAGLDSDRRR